jgi:hypothetical protein
MFCDISEHSLDVRMRLRGVLLQVCIRALAPQIHHSYKSELCLQASKFGSASSSNCTLFRFAFTNTTLAALNAAPRDALYWVITEKKEFFTFLPSAGAVQERLDDVLLILEQYRQWAETDGADCTSLWGVMCALVKRLIKFSRMVDVLASNRLVAVVFAQLARCSTHTYLLQLHWTTRDYMVAQSLHCKQWCASSSRRASNDEVCILITLPLHRALHVPHSFSGLLSFKPTILLLLSHRILSLSNLHRVAPN